MAKKALKRAWTPADLKTLKALSKKKTHAGRIAKALKTQRGRYATESLQPGVVTRFALTPVEHSA